MQFALAFVSVAYAAAPDVVLAVAVAVVLNVHLEIKNPLWREVIGSRSGMDGLARKAPLSQLPKKRGRALSD